MRLEAAYEVVDGIRTVARGESLLAPGVTRTLIGRYAERVRPAGASLGGRVQTVVLAYRVGLVAAGD